MARMVQVMVRMSPEMIEKLDEIGAELGLVNTGGPRIGETNIAETVRALLVKADPRLEEADRG